MSRKNVEPMLRGIAFDAASVREVDANGFLHIATSPLTREQVAPYFGREIPGAESHGFAPSKTYFGWRPAEELRRPETLKSTEGIPIQLAHHPDYADAPAKKTRVGQTGTDAEWRPPYLMNSLHILDKEAQERIQDGSMRELSLAYSYEPDFTSGTTPSGEHYDFIMRDILANHVALVREGRAGPKVLVYDSKHGDDVMEKNTFEAGAEFDPAAEALEVFLNSLPAKLLKKALAAQKGPEAEDEDEDEEQEEVAEERPEDAPAEATPEAEPEAEDENEEQPEAPEEPEDDDPIAKDDDEAIKAAGLEGEPEAVQRAFIKGLHFCAEQKPAEDEELDVENPEEESPEAEDSEDEEKVEKKPAEDCGEVDPKKIAQDAARHVQDTFVALEEVRPVLGRLRIGAYDSAGAVYKAALRKVGITRIKAGAEREAFQAYLTGAKCGRRPAIAQDSAQQTSGGLMSVMSAVKTNH